MTQLKRVAHWLKSLAAPTITPETAAVSPLEFRPAAWHGDHWQNLLASPMDARRYVIEDWATPLDDDLVAEETTASTWA
ncbi:hypothetical protein [Caballeronia ptereochthonis]|jgi:hypothetical protein|uniref:Uncharacterized protein n=1 Tax=Caballeronia ptereochthonis TaxID=1777144 RepID=A0A158AMQ6_9BURK|nr:hypothetical protein [Caballeronia ptereochthonis]SAK59178.1 hypothetical protein AWB83_02067 [Caballeronia ptereochthonis]